ncbi:hypothetical protein ALT785_60027 [Alteromonas infernus]
MVRSSLISMEKLTGYANINVIFSRVLVIWLIPNLLFSCLY